MIVEAIMLTIIGVIGKLINFKAVYDAFGIDQSAHFFIPTPLWYLFQTFGTMALAASPLAVGWWVWRNVKA